MFEGDESGVAGVAFVDEDGEFGGAGDEGGVGEFGFEREGFGNGSGAMVAGEGGGIRGNAGGERGGGSEGEGFADGAVAGATAEVAAELIGDSGGVGLSAASGGLGHGADEAGGAVTALGTAVGDHELLSGMEGAIGCGEAFAGEDGTSD